MKTIEIFAEAVKFASEASDIPSDRILSESRDADVVDARMLVIQTLYDIGLYPRRIAEMFGMTPSNVRHTLLCTIANYKPVFTFFSMLSRTGSIFLLIAVFSLIVRSSSRLSARIVRASLWILYESRTMDSIPDKEPEISVILWYWF